MPALIAEQLQEVEHVCLMGRDGFPFSARAGGERPSCRDRAQNVDV